MTKGMKDLENSSVDVKTSMEGNNINNREIPTGVPGWLNDVEDLKKNVQSISSDGIGCLNLKKRYRAGRNAFKATRRIEELIAENSGFNWTNVPIPTGRVNPKPASSTTCTPSFSSLGGVLFKSREKPFNEALKFLQQENNKIQVFALCGMGGVGKTTMMEQLEKVAKDNQMFDFIVSVAIGRTPTMNYIQNEIARKLGGEGLREETETHRADSLCRKFKEILEVQNKKILVILDDVWENIELKHIGITSPLSNGLKLLLTSRNSDICTQIAARAGSDLQKVRVDDLEVAEAQNLFFQIAKITEEDDHDKYVIGCEIVKKCGRLPLAIKLIASTLNSQEDYVWRDRYNHLRNNDVSDDVQKIIMFSYEYIKEDEDKEIFLHCGLFPEDANIQIEDLTRYAWGLKLFKNLSTLRDVRDRTNTCVHNLINANLLINSDHVGRVKMHDLVLAFVLDTVSKRERAWIINHNRISKWDGDEIGESCKRVSLTCKGLSEFPRDFKYPHLSLLKLMHGDESLKFPKIFYENMEKLEVIAYYDMQYPLLPRSLQCSTNLKSLCLQHCKLMFDCSFIGDLVNLEVLSFAHCGILKLPSTIGNLRKLKLLDLTGCVVLHIADGVFKNLENLEELYMSSGMGFYMSLGMVAIRFTKENFEELKMLSSQLYALEVEFVEEIAQLKNVCFKKLHNFKISVGCLLENKYNAIYSFKNTLKLVTDCNYLLDSKINELFKKTEKLHLRVKNMISVEDILSSHPYDQRPFCKLRDLEVSNCANMKYIFPISVVSGLTILERLKISSCPVLEALVQHNGNEINSVGDMIKLGKLKSLSLVKLPKLVCLFFIDNVVELPQLVELEVNGLPNFTSIYHEKNNIHALLNSQIRISKLKKMKIKSMENLKHIWDVSNLSSEVNVNNISMLSEIWVEGCDSLVNLLPMNRMRLLNHLERLMVDSCGSIEEIFNMECIGQVELVTNSRLRRNEVSESEKVIEAWRIKGDENIRFEKLKFLSLKMLPKLVCLFRIDNVVELPQLIELNVDGLPNFTSIYPDKNNNSAFEQPFFNSQVKVSELKKLNIKSMEKLKQIWSLSNQSSEEDANNISMLREIWVEGCDSLVNMFPTNPMRLLKHLEMLRVRGCGSIEEIFNIDLGCVGEVEQANESRLRSIIVSYSEKLKEVWRIKGGENNSSLPIRGFEAVERINIYQCKRFRNVFSPTNTNTITKFDMRALTNIKIDCDSRWQEEEVEFLSRKERDDISVVAFQSNLMHSFHNLQELSLYDYNDVEVVFEIVQVAEK